MSVPTHRKTTAAQRLWPAAWLPAITAIAHAHEGHTHPEDTLSLAQIVAVIAVTLGLYFAVNFIKQRRRRRPTRAPNTDDSTDKSEK